ncbi:MAG: uracil-DNA glycosylase family protein [Neptuniibacter sp.]
MKKLIEEIEKCRACEKDLPLGPRPVIQVQSSARILIIGQAPGTRVHQTGVPWNDPSGDRLREWLQMDKDEFYDANKVAIMPMGFCYPGKGKSGDLPPRTECAPLWHDRILQKLQRLELVLLIGQYAQNYYLLQQGLMKEHKTLTQRVRHFEECPAPYFPLPHPSPRNQIWLKKNPWFYDDCIPALRETLNSLKS